MSISMRDLNSSSDDDDDDDDDDDKGVEKNNIHKVNKDVKSPYLAITGKSKSYINIFGESNRDRSVKNSSSPHISPSKGEMEQSLNKDCIKGPESGSLRQITTNISPGASFDSSFSNSFEGESSTKPAMLPKFLSESDLINKSYQDIADGKDGLSKKEWFKGQFSSYLSKSRNYYYNRNNSPQTGKGKNSNQTSDQNKKEFKTPLTSEKVMDHGKEQKDSTFQQSLEAAVDLSSMSTNSCHLPTIVDVKLSENTTLGKNTFNKIKQINSSPVKVEDIPTSKSKLITSRLKFSDLLHNTSSSTNESLEEATVNMVPQKDKTNITKDDADVSDVEINFLADQIVKEDLKYHFRPNNGTTVTFHKLWIASLLMFAYLLFELPNFVSGVVTGAIIMYLVGCMMIWLICPSVEIYDQYKGDLRNYIIKNLKNTKQPEIPKDIPKPEILQKPRDLKGWMNLSYFYDNVYDNETTKDVYAIVHEETLFLFISKKKLEENPLRTKAKQRALARNKKKQKKLQSVELDEGPFICFIQQVQIDLTKCSLHLIPDDLPIRRIWNKKYPMKLETSAKDIKKKDINLSLEELTLSINDILEGVDLTDSRDSLPNVIEENILFLFGNTGREKEDWFYRMQLCISPLKHQVNFNNMRQNKLPEQPGTSYAHYMTELITESEKVIQRNVNGKKVEPYLAWLNIFIGRAFWDFWHDKYWTDKLHQKIQSRLSKINTPPFITDIKLKQLNCGHNIPIIHKGSLPVLDEYGVWTDLQVTYKGYFTLTLETQLNVDYYVGLVSSIVKQTSGTDSKENVQLSKMTKLSQISNDGNEDVELNDRNVDDEELHSELHDEIQDVFFDAFDTTDGNPEQDIMDPIMADPRTKAFLESRAGKKVVGLVGWLSKSRLAKRVAETDFAKKAYERAYEKFRKMPIILKVEVQSLKGNLAINIPPPPTNRLWFGFRNNPVMFITATPKVGEKQVRLTYLTNWIEKKLKEEFKKYLVLPSMQDISIKLMDSQLKDLYPNRPSS